jgi:hypothetical protein
MKYPAQNLIDAVKSNLSSVAAAEKFRVPERTIRAHRQIPLQKTGAGRFRYLDDDQENHLVSLFELLPNYGFSLTTDVTLQLASEYMKSLGLSVMPGRKWLRTFVRRHRLKIKWKKEEKLERERGVKFTEEARQGWFSLLKSTLEKLDLMDKPAQIFNGDESGFSDKTGSKLMNKLSPLFMEFYVGKHVIVNSSTRHVFEENGGSGRNYTTALIAISAAGQVLPPFVVYSGKNLINNWCKDGQDGSHYAVTDKVTIALFLNPFLVSISK